MVQYRYIILWCTLKDLKSWFWENIIGVHNHIIIARIETVNTYIGGQSKYNSIHGPSFTQSPIQTPTDRHSTFYILVLAASS